MHLYELSNASSFEITAPLATVLNFTIGDEMKFLLFGLLVAIPYQAFSSVTLSCNVQPSAIWSKDRQYITHFNISVDKDPDTGRYLKIYGEQNNTDGYEITLQDGVISVHWEKWSSYDHYVVAATIESDKGMLNQHISIDCLGDADIEYKILCESK
jgi:hypothetical protein